jgi:hypothetical protein
MARRWVLAAGLVLTWWVGFADSPAGADAAVPTNDESRVLAVEPATDAVAVAVRGGDAFLELTVQPGHTVEVPDYGADADGPLYLRFSADGQVERNERSVAAAVNESRFGDDRGAAAPEAPPVWRTVATDGSYAWHDHRIHLMVSDRFAVVDDGGRVDLGGPDGTWEVLVVVDGTETAITGELVRRSAPPAWPWFLLAAASAVGLVVVAVARVGPTWTVAAALAVLAGLAAVVSAAEVGAAPPSAGASRVPLLLSAAAGFGALLASAAALVGARAAGAARAVRVGLAGAAAALGWWAVTRVDVLSHRILPSGLPVLDRTTTAVALGASVGAAVVLAWRPERIGGGHPTATRPSSGI